MKYFLYDEKTGKIQHYGESPDNLTESFISGLLLIDATGYSQNDINLLQVINGELVNAPPVELKATNYQIKTKWQELEQRPILVLGVTVDCDLASEARMVDKLMVWDQLPTSPNSFEIIDGVKKVYWKLADNTYIMLSKIDLIDLLGAIQTARAIRSSQLFNAYQRIKLIEHVTVTYINDTSNWLE